MAPNRFVFRREEERKATEVVDDLDKDYRAEKPGAPRPTISAVVAKLQAIRNHSVGRQKKRYLEALAEKVLDERQAQQRQIRTSHGDGTNGDQTKRDKIEGAGPRGIQAEGAEIKGDEIMETTGATPPVVDAGGRADSMATPMNISTSEGKEDDFAMSAVNEGAADESLSTTTARRRVRRLGRERDREAPRKRKRRRYTGSSSEEGGARGGDDDDDYQKRRPALRTEILPNGPKLEDIAGMDDIVDRCAGYFSMPLCQGVEFEDGGSRPNEAVLLYGPSGCGKTLLANVIAAEAGVPFFSVSGPSLIGGISGESETNIRNIFDEAIKQAPSLIFVDEIEAIAGKQDFSGKGSMETRMALTLANCIDRLSWETSQGKYVIVLAATNKADSLDPFVRRRFDVEIAVRMPSQDAREHILRTMTRGMRLANDVDLKEIARMTPGFVGGDLRNVVKTAQLNFMDTVRDALLSQLRKENGLPPTERNVRQDFRLLCGYKNARLATPAAPVDSTLASAGNASSDASVTMQNFRDAAASVLPAAKREGFSTIPNTTWSQVGAMEVLRKKLEMSIIGPIRYPDKYAKVGQKPTGGILLWGPPGCGKTLVAKAVANESKANFISIRGPELLNKWVGESERALRELFERARAMAPCIIFFDEMDALAAKRDDARSDGSARIVNTLLTELDGVVDRTGLFVIGATNRPDIIDPAIKRPGRLGESIFVGPPTVDDRVAILQTLYHNAIPDDSQTAESLELLATVAKDVRCTGFSGADLDHLLRAAGTNSLERTGLHSAEMPRITEEDWEVALNETQPSTSLAELERYESLQ